MNGSWYNWDVINAGRTGYSREICGYDGRPMASCKCILVHRGLAIWGEILTYKGCQEAERSPVSCQLESLLSVEVSEANVIEVAQEIVNLTSSNVTLVPVDIMYTASLLQRITEVPFLDRQVGDALLGAVNNMLQTDIEVVLEAQRIDQSTTRTLEALDAYCRSADHGEGNRTEIVKSLVALDVRDFTETTDVIGFGSRVGSEKLTNDSLVYYTPEDAVDVTQSDAVVLLSKEVIAKARAAHAKWKSLLERETDPDGILRLMTSKVRLKFMVFQSAALFLTPDQVEGKTAYQTANSRVIAASVLQLPIKHLYQPITMMFLPTSQQAPDDAACGYWQTPGTSGTCKNGNWSTQGVWYNSTTEGRVVCHSDHLTNFALLAKVQRGEPIPEIHNQILGIISLIGLSVSIIGYSLTILTFIMFRKLRNSKFESQRVLVNLAVSSLLGNVIFLAGINQTDDLIACMIVSAFLHYFVLVSFFWMMVEAIVQYYRCVKIFQQDITSNFMLKTIPVCWGIPALIVGAMSIYDYQLLLDDHPGCWLSEEAYLYAFLVPVVIIIVFNTIVFILIVKSLYCLDRRSRALSNITRRQDIIMRSSCTAGCFVVLGLSWIFGLLAVETADIVFQYIFCILTTPQGFLIYLLFTLREPTIRAAWKEKLRYIKFFNEQNKVAPAAMRSVSVTSTTNIMEGGHSMVESFAESKLQPACIKPFTVTGTNKVVPERSISDSPTSLPDIIFTLMPVMESPEECNVTSSEAGSDPTREEVDC